MPSSSRPSCPNPKSPPLPQKLSHPMLQQNLSHLCDQSSPWNPPIQQQQIRSLTPPRSEQSIRVDQGMMEDESVVSNGGGGEEVVVADGGDRGVGGTERSGGEDGGNVVQVLQLSIGEVQGILEQNRVLIQEISQNHKARDADGLTRNVALIRELNTNIARVVDLYANLSGSFSNSITTSDAATANNTNTTNSSSPSAATSSKVSKQPGTTDAE